MNCWITFCVASFLSSPPHHAKRRLALSEPLPADAVAVSEAADVVAAPVAEVDAVSELEELPHPASIAAARDAAMTVAAIFFFI